MNAEAAPTDARPEAGPSTERNAPPNPPSATPPTGGAALARWVDGATDLAVLGFAAWTLLYQSANLLNWPTNPITIAWLVVMVALGVLVVRRVRSEGEATTAAVSAATGGEPLIPLWRDPVILAVGVLTLVSVVVIRTSVGTPWLIGWALGVACGLIAVWRVLAARPRTRATRANPGNEPSPAPVPLWSHLIALVVSLGWAGFSLIALRVDPDDAFYVNKAVFVGERGVIPTRDTIFGDQTLPPLPGAGTAPLQSIEVFQGAIAHLFGLNPTSVVYLAFPPIATFVATWSIWRLIREWARLRAAFAFALSMVYLAMSGQVGAGMGVFFLARIWQGKVVFVAALIPLIYLYITRWAKTQSRWSLLLLTAAGIASVGLTSSATFVVPIIAVTCAVALLVTKRPWAGALAVAAYPVITGGIVALTGVPGDPGGKFYAGAAAFHFVLGFGVLSGVGWAAILLANWISVSGATRVVVLAATMGLLVILAPGMAAAFSQATGAGAVAWRLMWIAPVTVMVGLLGTLPFDLSRRRAPQSPDAAEGDLSRAAARTALPAAGVTAAFMAALMIWGTPLWSHVRSVSIQSKPTWKFPSIYIKQAKAIEDLAPGPGPVLAPLSTMRALSLVTSDVHAVAARPSYVLILEEDPVRHEARSVLVESYGGNVGRKAPKHTEQEFHAALKTLDVSLACVRPTQKQLAGWLDSAGWQPKPLRELICYTP